MTVERIAGPVEVDVLGQGHRQIGFRYRYDPAGIAVNDRDRAAPVALARNAPVAQPKIDLPDSDRAIAAALAFEQSRDLLFGLLDGHAVEETGIDHAPVAFIGGVGDDEGRRVLLRRANNRSVSELVFVREIEVALVMRGAAEDRSRAVVHDNEIGDIDR